MGSSSVQTYWVCRQDLVVTNFGAQKILVRLADVAASVYKVVGYWREGKDWNSVQVDLMEKG
jgi:hypothetical protein